MVGIYKITNPQGKVYIGQSSNIENRFKYYKRLACKKQCKLYNSLQKYKPENHIFEVIEECNIIYLNQREEFWIKQYNSVKNGLNLCYGGEGGGNKSLETKIKMRISHKGKQHNIETKEKISKSKKYHPMYDYKWKEKIKNSLIGRKITWADKISKSKTGHPSSFLGKQHTKETKEKMSNYRKIHYKNTHKTKIIIQYDLNDNMIKEYNSLKSAEMENNPQGKVKNNISSCLTGKQKTAYGFKWKYEK